MSSKWYFICGTNHISSCPSLITYLISSGDLLKQVKVKKLTKLKTLDTKPGAPEAIRLYLNYTKQNGRVL